MSEIAKHYVGLDLTGFENNGRLLPITRVTLMVDDDNAITAGDDTGRELVADCPFATQEMVNALLDVLRGHVYHPYSADDTNLDPAAELGDGVTVSGIYSVISRISDDGSGYASLTAPGEAELEDEFPSAGGPMTQEFNRKLAQTRSTITKTAEEISLRIEGVEQKAQESLANYAETVTASMANLQDQIDGQIETFYYDYAPTLDNAPASSWKTETERARHEGDLFYWKSKGYAYRFFKDGGTWKWQLVQDTDITAAMAQAAEAQDTADSKRRVFVSTPKPPYDVGDLWSQGANGDLMRCQTARSSGDYVSSDWAKASKYTDDTVANEAKSSIVELNVTLEGITQRVTGLDGKYTEVSTTLDGLTVKDASGTTKIRGSGIETESLAVGSISADKINMTGAITWNDLSSSVQSRINNAGDTVPGYIHGTYIDEVEIRSPEITGEDIRTYGYFRTYNPKTEEFAGYIGAAYGSTNNRETNGVAMTYGSPTQTLGDSGHYIIVTDAGVRIQSGSHSFYVIDRGAYYDGVEIGEGGIAVFG